MGKLGFRLNLKFLVHHKGFRNILRRTGAQYPIFAGAGKNRVKGAGHKGVKTLVVIYGCWMGLTSVLFYIARLVCSEQCLQRKYPCSSLLPYSRIA